MTPGNNRTGWGRAVAFVANGLVRDHGEIVKLGFKPEVFEKINFDFHEQRTGFAELSGLSKAGRPLSSFCRPASWVAYKSAGNVRTSTDVSGRPGLSIAFYLYPTMGHQCGENNGTAGQAQGGGNLAEKQPHQKRAQYGFQ